MPDLSNETQMMEVLKQGSPELYAIKLAMNETGVNVDTILHTLRAIDNIQRFSKWGKTIILIQDGKVVRVEQSQGIKIQ